MNIKTFLFLFIFFLLGCLNQEFQGLESISNITDSSATLNWSPNPKISAFNIIQIENKKETYVDTVSKEKTSYLISTLLPGKKYGFKIIGIDIAGKLVDTKKILYVTTKLVPSPPEKMTLTNPYSNLHFLRTPTFTIENLNNNYIANLYLDEKCQRKIGEAKVTNFKAEITTQKLPIGENSFYSNVKGLSGSISICSKQLAKYTVKPCPDDYVAIDNKSKDNPEIFCVMKMEARKDIADGPSQNPENFPWGNLTYHEAEKACQGLGEDFDLISNTEWMIIANLIEKNKNNWVFDSFSKKWKLHQGHSDNIPSQMLNIKDISNPFDQTDESKKVYGAVNDQRRALEVSPSEFIWDFAGNLWEWTKIDFSPAKCPEEWTELKDTKCDQLPSPIYMPIDPTLDSSNNVGKFFGGNGEALIRGGGWSNGLNSGIYSMHLKNAKENKYHFIGFRCSYKITE